jgi:hypothetical protein
MKKLQILGTNFYRFYYPKISEVKRQLEKLTYQSNPFNTERNNLIWDGVSKDGNNKNLHNLPKFKSLFEWMHSCLDEVAKDLKITAKLKVCSSWCNLNKKNDYFHDHQHPNSFISSNLYVSGHEKDHTVWYLPNPYFTSLYPIGPEGFDNKVHLLEYSEKTEPGKFIVFPSMINHYAERNTSNEDRMTIAANFFPTGLITCGGVSTLKIEVQ